MNKKVSLGVTISLIAVACAITFVLTMTVSLNMYNSMVAGIEERETIYNKIKEIDSFVRVSSIYDLDEDDIINGAMCGYIDGIEDEYARYYTADEYYKQQQIQSGEIIGVGVETEINGSYLKVTHIYPDSSADVAQITEGFIITAIDGKNLLELQPEQAQKMLDGDEGTKVKLTVQKPDGTTHDEMLIRQTIKIKSVTGKLVNGYAMIKISTFNKTTSEQLLQLIDLYEAQSVLGYIFDVRDCSDGIIDPLATMLNKLLPKAIVATSRDAEGAETNLVETDGLQSVDKPITVLVNGKTACVAELFAVALRDFGGASVIGTVTFGKTELQTVQSFKDGSAISISTSRMYPTASEDFFKTGIKPDYTVDITEQQAQGVEFGNPETDPQLQKALEIIAAN